MTVAIIVPLVFQLLQASLKIAELVEASKDINPKDKETLRALIKEAKSGVTYITDDEKTEEGS